MNSTHYSYAQNPRMLDKTAERLANKLKKHLVKISAEVKKSSKAKCVPVLMYTGLSGISLATMVSNKLWKLRVKHNMAYVRKAGEKSHGCAIENTIRLYDNTVVIPVFVDDFIETGKTMMRVVGKVSDCVRENNRDAKLHDKIIVLQGSSYRPASLSEKNIKEVLK